MRPMAQAKGSRAGFALGLKRMAEGQKKASAALSSMLPATTRPVEFHVRCVTAL
jgi:hypothetical protein